MAEADRRRIRLWSTEVGRPVGSGVLIAGRIVLTSADACQANDSPTVERPGSDRRYGTRRLWPADRSESTAALLEITDNEWTDLDSAIRCGVIASGDQWIRSMIDGERVAAIEINNLATLPDVCWES